MDSVRRLVDWNDLGPHRFLEEAPSAVMLVDPAGKIVWANRAAVTLFGYARPEIVGRSVEMLLPQDRRSDHGEYLARWFRHPHSRLMGADLGIQGRNKNGDLLDLDIQLSPIETDKGIMACAWVRERGSK